MVSVEDCARTPVVSAVSCEEVVVVLRKEGTRSGQRFLPLSSLHATLLFYLIVTTYGSIYTLSTRYAASPSLCSNFHLNGVQGRQVGRYTYQTGTLHLPGSPIGVAQLDKRQGQAVQ